MHVACGCFEMPMSHSFTYQYSQSLCRMLNEINGNVAFQSRFIFPIVTCQILEKPISLVTIFLSPRRMSLGPMLYVKFKKCPCCCVDFRGLGPSYWDI